MEVAFLNSDLKELYETGYSRAFKKVPPEVVKKLPRAIAVIEAAKDIYDLWGFPGYRFKTLSDGSYSMRLDRTWRLEMEIEWKNEQCTIGIVGLTDLTHHYGD